LNKIGLFLWILLGQVQWPNVADTFVLYMYALRALNF